MLRKADTGGEIYFLQIAALVVYGDLSGIIQDHVQNRGFGSGISIRVNRITPESYTLSFCDGKLFIVNSYFHLNLFIRISCHKAAQRSAQRNRNRRCVPALRWWVLILP